MILMVKLKDYERGVETLSLHHQMNLKLKKKLLSITTTVLCISNFTVIVTY